MSLVLNSLDVGQGACLRDCLGNPAKMAALQQAVEREVSQTNGGNGNRGPEHVVMATLLVIASLASDAMDMELSATLDFILVDKTSFGVLAALVGRGAMPPNVGTLVETRMS
jgi:hypothetical protein